MGNIRTCKEVRLQNVLSLDCQDSIRCGIFQVATGQVLKFPE